MWSARGAVSGACGDPFSWTLSPSCDVCGGVLGQGVVDVELVRGALSWLAQVGEGGGPLDESLKRGSLHQENVESMIYLDKHDQKV